MAVPKLQVVPRIPWPRNILLSVHPSRYVPWQPDDQQLVNWELVVGMRGPRSLACVTFGLFSLSSGLV